MHEPNALFWGSILINGGLCGLSVWAAAHGYRTRSLALVAGGYGSALFFGSLALVTLLRASL